MATIYDGAAVFTAVAGATALAADQNTTQAQLIMGLEARTQILSPAMGHKETQAASNWDFECDAADPPRWEDPVCNVQDNLIIPIPLRYKEYVEDIYVNVSGAEGAAPGNRGEIGLYYTYLDTTTPAAPVMVSVQDLGGATPWNVGGAITTYSQVGLNLSAAATEDRTYFLYIQSHDGAAVSHARYYGCKIVTRFHIGT